MKSLLFIALLFLVSVSAQAQKQKLRVYCRAELSTATTKLDSLQYQERWFRERATTTTNAGRCMYWMAEWMAARIYYEMNPPAAMHSPAIPTEIEKRAQKYIFK